MPLDLANIAIAVMNGNLAMALPVPDLAAALAFHTEAAQRLEVLSSTRESRDVTTFQELADAWPR